MKRCIFLLAILASACGTARATPPNAASPNDPTLTVVGVIGAFIRANQGTMTLKDWADVVQSLAVLAAAVAAIVGLNIWRVETRRKFEWELARRTLRAVYRVRDTISEFRGTTVNSEELAYGVGELANPVHLDAAGIERHNNALQARRWNYVREAYRELSAILPEVEAAWKGSARKRFAALMELEVRLYMAHTTMSFGTHGADLPEEHRRRLVLDLSGPDLEAPGQHEPDEFGLALDAAIENAEGILLTKMSL